MSLWTAWLLLMLREGESYGRALFGGLRERGIAVDRALGYRTLHALEDAGAITSRWTESGAGPRRRSYRLTAKGRRRLAQLAANIAATAQLHERFLLEDERVRGGSASQKRSAQSAEIEHALRGVGDRRGEAAPASDDAALPTVSRDLLAAWLLLLLTQDASYGYGLRHALDEHDIPCDPAALYRLLRALDADGWLRSSWLKSAAGPPRRLYAVTSEGSSRLDDLRVVLAATRDTHAAFLHAYHHAARKPPRRGRRADAQT